MARTLAFASAAALLCAGALASREEPAFAYCQKADDCVSDTNLDDGTVTCSYFDQVTVAATATEKQATYNYGICVQCESDGNCRENEWCAPISGFTFSKWWSDAQRTRMSEGQQNAADNLFDSITNGAWAPRGKCVEFGAFSDEESEKLGSACNTNTNALTNDPEKANDKAQCQFAFAWQPEFVKCVGDNCPTTATKNGAWHSPGTSSAVVMNNGARGSFTSVKSDSGIGWTGSCVDNVCQVCQDGDSRGSVLYGQQCFGKQYGPTNFVDYTPRTINHSITAQLALAAVVFLAFIMLIGMFSCCYTIKTGTAAGKV